ncbi:MAG: hypothetical protein WDO56_09640 [Gammaproteobacteria bacterium]
MYRLEGTLGYAIDLIVAPDEEFVGVAGGELEAVVIATHANRLTIKPKTAPLLRTSRPTPTFAPTRSNIT